MSDAVHTLDSELQQLKGEAAVAHGGIAAFCPAQYQMATASCGECECNATLAHHAILCLEHMDVWPAVGGS